MSTAIERHFYKSMHKFYETCVAKMIDQFLF